RLAGALAVAGKVDGHGGEAAWQKPETIIVNEPWWNATARQSDIVFPATLNLERNDLGFTMLDTYLTPIRQAIAPYQQARNDYEIFVELADRLDIREAFTEGRDEAMWLKYLYQEATERAAKHQIELPDFDTFWQGEQRSIFDQIQTRPSFLQLFRQDPNETPLGTPSGKIEIFSETIARFAYDDCPPHPTWLPPTEWLGAPKAQAYPLHLLSNQPKTRLHSQFDHANTSREAKLNGREVARLNPQDAAVRGIQADDVIRLFNERGTCLASVVLSEAIRPGVVQLPTGAWYTPAEPGQIGALECHGNPNVLTLDKGTSKLGQGPAANSTLVDVELYSGPVTSAQPFNPPMIKAEGQKQ
ncbi:MAG: molybdopterin dinucleotide binding domain-containing protein, partial [Chloroflexota bacterium]